MRRDCVVFYLLFITAVLFTLSDVNAQQCETFADCPPGDSCTSYTCLGGECVPLITTCSDPPVSTCQEFVECDPEVGCIFGPKPDGASCFDFGTVCTANKTCQAGQCVETLKTCEDMNECTADSCDFIEGCLNEPVEDGISCNEGQGVCSAGACVDKGCECESPDAITRGKSFFGKTYYFGTAGADTICTGDEKDVVFAFSGDDCIDTGDGRDRVFAGFGNDTVSLGPGSDRAWGGPGDDIIDGEEGSDFVNGGSGFDLCKGEITKRCESLPEHCANALLDGNESDIDCGGGCLPCGSGLLCEFDSDCESNVCLGDNSCQ